MVVCFSNIYNSRNYIGLIAPVLPQNVLVMIYNSRNYIGLIATLAFLYLLLYLQ